MQFHMMRKLALVMLFSAALDAAAALADAKQDCETMNGDVALQACNQAIRQYPRDPANYFAAQSNTK
jgi:hypothetical protein